MSSPETPMSDASLTTPTPKLDPSSVLSTVDVKDDQPTLPPLTQVETTDVHATLKSPPLPSDSQLTAIDAPLPPKEVGVEKGNAQNKNLISRGDASSRQSRAEAPRRYFTAKMSVSETALWEDNSPSEADSHTDTDAHTHTHVAGRAHRYKDRLSDRPNSRNRFQTPRGFRSSSSEQEGEGERKAMFFESPMFASPQILPEPLSSTAPSDPLKQKPTMSAMRRPLRCVTPQRSDTGDTRSSSERILESTTATAFQFSSDVCRSRKRQNLSPESVGYSLESPTPESSTSESFKSGVGSKSGVRSKSGDGSPRRPTAGRRDRADSNNAMTVDGKRSRVAGAPELLRPEYWRASTNQQARFDGPAKTADVGPDPPCEACTFTDCVANLVALGDLVLHDSGCRCNLSHTAHTSHTSHTGVSHSDHTGSNVTNGGVKEATSLMRSRSTIDLSSPYSRRPRPSGKTEISLSLLSTLQAFCQIITATLLAQLPTTLPVSLLSLSSLDSLATRIVDMVTPSISDVTIPDEIIWDLPTVHKMIKLKNSAAASAREARARKIAEEPTAGSKIGTKTYFAPLHLMTSCNSQWTIRHKNCWEKLRRQTWPLPCPTHAFHTLPLAQKYGLPSAAMSADN